MSKPSLASISPNADDSPTSLDSGPGLEVDFRKAGRIRIGPGDVFGWATKLRKQGQEDLSLLSCWRPFGTPFCPSPEDEP